MNSTTDADSRAPKSSLWSAWQHTLEQHTWIPFVLPFAVFMLAGLLEPSRDTERAAPRAAPSAKLEPAETESRDRQARKSPILPYPAAYAIRIALTAVAVGLVVPGWRKIPWRYSHWAILIGLVGGVLWIGICWLDLFDAVLTRVGLERWTSLGDRPAFDPYTALGDSPAVMVGFLATRLIGLACIVPLIEEFFLRGFLMRFIEQADWWTVDVGTVGPKAAITATVYGVLAHPAEPIAAAVWFSLITVLHARTRSLWSCVVAHAITNGMLGLYVLAFRDWTLW